MIPSYSQLMQLSFSESDPITSSDHKLTHLHEFKDKYISGFVSDLLAMEQVVFKILNTQRYAYPIYSWNYGVELLDLFGKPVYFVCAELQRRITEALTQDDRIDSVSDFSFDTSIKHIVTTSFTVSTIFGSFLYSLEVDF